jgi:hypothetical protein
VDVNNKLIENKISVKVSPEIRNKLMTDGLKLFLKSHPERERNPPCFDEMFGNAVDLYCNSYIIPDNIVNFVRKLAPEMFEDKNDK